MQDYFVVGCFGFDVFKITLCPIYVTFFLVSLKKNYVLPLLW